jgi:hypothetical protein
VRVYLNTSALNRPFDDLSAARIRFEAEADGAQILVTTDDRMLRRAARARGEIRLDVLTPVQALARLSTEHEP